MDVALLLLRDRGERRRFPVTADAVVVGRREDCSLRIPLGDVSRRHCSLVQDAGRLVVKDLGSSNGTFVNGKRVNEAELKPGDLLKIGSLRFVVQIDGRPTDDEIGAYTPSTQGRPDAEADDIGDDDWDASTSRTDVGDDT